MLKRVLLSALFCGVPVLAQGCSAADPGETPTTGGFPSGTTGGTNATSGGTSSTTPTGGTATATGGSGLTGGTSTGTGGTTSSSGGSSTATGGTSTTGGASPTGGTASSGGSSSRGGSTTGGLNSMGGGGAASTGGGTSKGGSASSGGSKSTGGSSAQGGSSAGGSSTGGATATGGSSTSTSAGPAETKPVGYGQNTTGGGSKAPVDASSMAAVQAAIDGYSGSGGLVIRYTGKFNFASITDPCTQHTLPGQIVEIKKKSDITIVGQDGSAANFGLHIASSSSNIIVRNMTFGLLPGGDASDVISIEGMSGGFPTNIWIDHNELFSSMVECAGAGDTAFDGLIDVKKGADNITVSYNYLHDHHKGTLNGYTDDDSEVRHITYHHNVFVNIGSRTPLQRHGYSHIANNLFSGLTVSGINVRMDGYALVEGNFFENAKNPVTSRDSSALGYWELKNNNVQSPADFTKFGITWSPSGDAPSKDATDWVTTKAYPVALGYTYAAQAPQCMKDGLRAVAGAGKGMATLNCQ